MSNFVYDVLANYVAECLVIITTVALPAFGRFAIPKLRKIKEGTKRKFMFFYNLVFGIALIVYALLFANVVWLTAFMLVCALVCLYTASSLFIRIENAFDKVERYLREEEPDK